MWRFFFCAQTIQSGRRVEMKKRGSKQFVSRGGEKLSAALAAFDVAPTAWVCADLGCNVGGFTDCLLQRGAARVYSVDTGYGELAWTLRRDDRVVVMERTNALHVTLPEPVKLVVIDVGWTRQHLILPVARSLLADDGVMITLIKPHYEAARSELRGGVLPDERIDGVLEEVTRRVTDIGMQWSAIMESPLRGQKGNREFLALIRD